MMHIQVELWMWLGDRLGGDFESVSEMRSTRGMDLEESLTVVQLFERLASENRLIAEKVFNRQKREFHPNLSVIVTQNGQVVSPFDIERSILKDGFKITVLPLYAGG